MPAGGSDDSRPSLPPTLLEALAEARFRSTDPEAAMEALCRAHPSHAAALRAAVEESQDGQTTRISPYESGAPAHPERQMQIGPYRITAVLGEGGMGTVYRATQEHPIRRTVALKIIKLGMDSREILARFGVERRALAAMNHTNIARIFDAGSTERGQPYFAMEFVDGVPLNVWCNQQGLSTHDRIELFCAVCAGVQHAHQKGVIHRDLKPGNVLVAVEDQQPVPKILDFGLAKAIRSEDFAQSLVTRHEVRMGTPEYMAPEQASIDPEVVLDTRADVYSLGVLLYELLTNTLPFDGQALRAEGWTSVQRILWEVEPPLPSVRLARLRDRPKHARVEAGSARTNALTREIRGDLDWIVMKAMAKEPERRYESADAFAEDLRRHLHHEPVLASPPSALYRVRKFARRYRGRLLATAAVLMTALTGAVVATDYAIEADSLAGERARVIDFLSLAVEGRNLVESAEDLHPERPDTLPALRAWLASADRLLDSGPDPAALDTAAGFRKFLDRTGSRLAEDLDQIAILRPFVARSERFAAQVARLTFAHPNARVTWDEARSAIAAADGHTASTLYADRDIPLDDSRVLGLVPLGCNPVTLLWEFYDLRSAWDGEQALDTVPIPQHDAEGRIEVTEETGIVFVLLPGGRCSLGSWLTPFTPHFDPLRQANEQLHDVDLDAFLLARHELTAGQWLRLRGDPALSAQPNHYEMGREVSQRGRDEPRRVDRRHPVERVSWIDCARLLRRHGLVLPTEAQWEYGCRGGTTTPWIVDREALGAYANLADSTYRAAVSTALFESWNDGHLIHAPAGSLAANAFGLHDMHGNVWEWCRDPIGSRYGDERAGDGLRTTPDEKVRVTRGGAFDTTARSARASSRSYETTTSQHEFLGLRAARLLQP